MKYRVVWKREGPSTEVEVLRQSQRGAEAKVTHLRWSDEQPRHANPSEPYDDLPKLERVRIERRTVGEWETCA